MKNKIEIEIGSIYYVNLGPEVDHCLAKIRPCIVVEKDRLTVTVYAFSDYDNKTIYHSEIPIPMGIGNLKKDSKIKMGQTITVDNKKVGSKIGELPNEYLTKIQEYIQTKGIVKKIHNTISNRKIKSNSTINTNIAH